MEVLEKVKQEHDTSMGVSRATVDIWADELFPVAFSDQDDQEENEHTE